jgi:hypothetical protein
MLLKMPLGGSFWMVIGIGKPNSNQIQTWIGGLAQIQGLQNRILDSIAQIVPRLKHLHLLPPVSTHR